MTCEFTSIMSECGCFFKLSTTGSVSGLQLKNAIRELIEQPGAQRPERIKFFRGQMQTIITRAVTDLEIKAIPSRRCFTLLSEDPATFSMCTSRVATYEGVTHSLDLR